MGISTKIQNATLDELHLDPHNPRLGRSGADGRLSQEEVLRRMDAWTLDELAVSFLDSGFWTQEALVVVEEKIGRQKGLVVVEGNRRLAALKLLDKARSGAPTSTRWRDLAKQGSARAFKKLDNIPYVKADSRADVQAYLGFRHVTGIKEWEPTEKAQFIAHMIDDLGLTYDEVRRKIGSKTPTVRQNYISYRLLLQMEGEGDSIAVDKVEERFSVLFLSLRTNGVQKYLHIDIQADPKSARRPVPKSRLAQLANFALWLFGNDEREPLVRDSRQVDKFGTILASSKALDYLERTDRPQFETAYRKAGGDEAEVTKLLDVAADNVEEALGTAHHHKKSRPLSRAVMRLGRDVLQLLDLFPNVRDELLVESD